MLFDTPLRVLSSLRGFEEYRLSANPKEILSAIKALDGVPCWLTHYGASRVDGKTHWDAIQDVLIEAEGYIRSEFEELERASRGTGLLWKSWRASLPGRTPLPGRK